MEEWKRSQVINRKIASCLLLNKVPNDEVSDTTEA